MSPSKQHSPVPNGMKRPPFGISFRLTPKQCARIHFGTKEGWDRCKREAALNLTDILLMSLDEDPCCFAWPVIDRDVLIFFETGITKEMLDRLCLALLKQGARNVMGLGAKKEDCFEILTHKKGEVAA